MGDNNIFKFATKELSQDAFIAWLVNWINSDKKNEKLLAQDFLIEILENRKDLEQWKSVINEEKYEVKVEVQFFNIDVLVMLHDIKQDQYLAIIIEDKVNTSEHDEQIKRYKSILKDSLDEKISEKISNENIVTCYYKTFDESGIEEKKHDVDKVFERKDILSLLNRYKYLEKDYFKDYLEYINAINECAEKYRDVEIADDIILKKKDDIKKLAFFRNLENKYKDYINNFSKREKISFQYYGNRKFKKNKKEIVVENNFTIKNYIGERIYYGIDTSGNGLTWWCNIPINFKVNSDIFSNYGFIKINFYKNSNRNTTVMLKIPKRVINIKNKNAYKSVGIDEKQTIKTLKYFYIDDNNDSDSNKYYNIYEYYDCRCFNNKNVYNKVISLLGLDSKNPSIKIKDMSIPINISGKGSTQTQPEINVFTITIDKKHSHSEQMDIIEEIVNNLKNNLDGKELDIYLNDTLDDIIVK